jgi:hypothetical protein
MTTTSKIPARLRRARLIDARGYPVPWFVAWIDGKPDHRVMDAAKMPRAVRLGLCWQCGQPLGRYKAFCIGPMCTITRTIAEPPSHLECLRYAVRACPWMTRPHAKRRAAGLPEDARPGAGLPITRNPGIACVWTTLSFRTFPAYDGNTGRLFKIGAPVAVEWWCEGRAATREEVEASIRSGLPLLEEQAQAQDAEEGGAAARTDLAARLRCLDELLPPARAAAASTGATQGGECRELANAAPTGDRT